MEKAGVEIVVRPARDRDRRPGRGGARRGPRGVRLAPARARAPRAQPDAGGARRLAGLLHPLRAARAPGRRAGPLLREPAGLGLAALPHPQDRAARRSHGRDLPVRAARSTRAAGCASSSWAIPLVDRIPPPAGPAERPRGAPPPGSRRGRARRGAAARQPAQRAAQLTAAPARRRAAPARVGPRAPLRAGPRAEPAARRARRAARSAVRPRRASPSRVRGRDLRRGARRRRGDHEARHRDPRDRAPRHALRGGGPRERADAPRSGGA